MHGNSNIKKVNSLFYSVTYCKGRRVLLPEVKSTWRIGNFSDTAVCPVAYRCRLHVTETRYQQVVCAIQCFQTFRN